MIVPPATDWHFAEQPIFRRLKYPIAEHTALLNGFKVSRPQDRTPLRREAALNTAHPSGT